MINVTIIKQRADFLKKVRAFFENKGVFEVDTPILSQFGNPDPALVNFEANYFGPGKLYKESLYLMTSPEYCMKKLLAEGSPSIFYLGKVFRNNELSFKHTPEFTMAEWYQIGYSFYELIEEVIEFINYCADQLIRVEKWSYQAIFEKFLQINVFEISEEELHQLLTKKGIDLTFTPETRDEYLDILMSHIIEPNLPKEQLTVIYHYPASQASLSKIITEDSYDVGLRFEVYWKGLELANGYEELTNSQEQKKRFIAENKLRLQYGQKAVKIDEPLIDILDNMPNCSGVAVGIDRLMMAVFDKTSINDVLLFPFEES